MKSRAEERRLNWKRAWAVLVALLPAVPCFGGDMPPGTNGGPGADDIARAVAVIQSGTAEPKPQGRPAPIAIESLPELPQIFKKDLPKVATPKPAQSASAKVDAVPIQVQSPRPSPPVPSPSSPPVQLAAAEVVAAPAPASPAAPLPFSAPPPPALDARTEPATMVTDPLDVAIDQAGCSTCGGFHTSSDGPAFHASFGCGNGSCVPGQQPCYSKVNVCDTVLGQFCANLSQALCCPDPCYEPVWVPAAYASLFADYARPRTVTRIRYDNLENMIAPDRNQFWLKQTGMNKRPFAIHGVKYQTDPTARLQQVSLYQEAAGQYGSFFIEIPYRQLNPLFSPTQAGFSDINFGIKSLVFDREMLQVSTQFRTYTPSGNAMAGLGTGHFSLDPSILMSLKLTPTTYFQGQFGNWIPLLGTEHIAGGVFYSFMSFNQELFRTSPNSPVIATLEMDAWSFENGGYTRPLYVAGPPMVHGVSTQIRTQGGGASYFNIGPGLRWSICNKVDLGGALTFATTTPHWAEPWFRFEVRFLF